MLTPNSLVEYANIITGPNAEGIRDKILEHVRAWKQTIGTLDLLEEEMQRLRDTVGTASMRVDRLFDILDEGGYDV